MKLFILLFLLCIDVVSHAIDPWDVKVTEHGVKCKPVECDCKKETSSVPTGTDNQIVHDVFYKKLISLILSKSRFKEKSGIFEGSTCFHIPSDQFKILQSYVNSNNYLTASQIRKIDGIMSEYICKQSFVAEIFETMTDYIKFVLNHYLWHILIGITTLTCCIVIYRSNWSNVSVKTIFLWLTLILVYVWEVKRTIEEAEHEEMVHLINKCTYNFIFYQVVADGCFTASSVSKLLKYGNPVYVIPNIFTKLILGNIMSFMEIVNKFILKICENVNSFYYTPVYVTLNILFFGIILFLTYAIIANYFFNQSFSMSFLFFNFNIRQRNIHSGGDNHQINSAQATPHIHQSGEVNNQNVAALIGIVKDLVQTKNSSNNPVAESSNSLNSNPIAVSGHSSNNNPALGSSHSSVKQKAIKANNPALGSSHCSVKQKTIKANNPANSECISPQTFLKHRRVGSVPDNLSRMGAGDFII